MPETRTEKAVFVLGVVAIAALGFLVVHLWHKSHRVAAPSATLPLSAPATAATLTQPTRRSTATTETGSTARPRTTTSTNTQTTPANTRRKTANAPAAGAVSLLVTAKTDTWLEIRSGSATGPVLYSGILAAASTKSFRARTLWARFAAAGNLSTRFDGKPLRLPSGTYDAVFDHGGFRQAGA